MLGVLLGIIKVIGIILLAILGLLVLLILIVLFLAIKYEASGESAGDFESTQVRIKVSWLWSLLRIRFSYSKEDSKLSVKILWFELIKEESPDESSYENTSEISHEVVPAREDSGESIPVTKESPPPQAEAPRISTEEKVKTEKTSWKDKAMKIFQKIKYTLKSIYDKITSVKDFLNEETTKIALRYFFKQLKKLLRRLTPKRFKGSVNIGFDDPATTGYLMAGYSALKPLAAFKEIELYPDLENKVLSGDLYIKGKIRMVYFLGMAITLLLKKEIRQTVKDGLALQKGVSNGK
ncbi:hypothetical protein [Ohessyouella blattaphilus]|uniref:DUF2953 domain-containing protein n=1 Tax=Ohessyouella blattaphilus TaxID=2949333 RepID=A0ABT1EFI8_9FIRM|nr:hypothetical protein [Ohessyouella blattaphilus]MCP1109281.1 hypothetical protein [Ohessyouella blattaphilus]MCR8562675.1 hypothetical protein [Ohessyouella blattaphilus]